MKSIKVIVSGLMVMGALLLSAPVTAQSAQEWQTSTMKGSGSAYAPQVTAVGATAVPSEATTTTATYSPAKSGFIRKNGEWGDNQDAGEGDEGSPIGDAVLPLLMMALVYGVGCLVYRRKHQRTLKAGNR